MGGWERDGGEKWGREMEGDWLLCESQASKHRIDTITLGQCCSVSPDKVIRLNMGPVEIDLVVDSNDDCVSKLRSLYATISNEEVPYQSCSCYAWGYCDLVR